MSRLFWFTVDVETHLPPGNPNTLMIAKPDLSSSAKAVRLRVAALGRWKKWSSNWSETIVFYLIWKIENKADFRVLEILIRLAFRLHPLGCIFWFQKIYNPIIVNYFKLGKCRTMTSSACTALCGIMRLAAPANAAFKSLSDIRAEYLKLKLKVRSLPRPTPGIATAISI